MFYFSFQSLTEQWVEKRVTQRDVFHYLVAHPILLAIARITDVFDRGEKSASQLSALEGLEIYLVFSIIGLTVVFSVLRSFYEANGGDEGERFTDKLVTLGFVANVRFSLLGLLALPLVKITSDTTTLVLICVVLLVSIFWIFFNCFNHIKNSLRIIRSASTPLSAASLT